jgi:hypothetical protein
MSEFTGIGNAMLARCPVCNDEGIIINHYATYIASFGSPKCECGAVKIIDKVYWNMGKHTWEFRNSVTKHKRRC